MEFDTGYRILYMFPIAALLLISAMIIIKVTEEPPNAVPKIDYIIMYTYWIPIDYGPQILKEHYDYGNCTTYPEYGLVCYNEPTTTQIYYNSDDTFVIVEDP